MDLRNKKNIEVLFKSYRCKSKNVKDVITAVAFLDVTIVVDANLSLQEAHDICDRVETHLEHNGISSVYVHPEPNTLNEK